MKRLRHHPNAPTNKTKIENTSLFTISIFARYPGGFGCSLPPPPPPPPPLHSPASSCLCIYAHRSWPKVNRENTHTMAHSKGCTVIQHPAAHNPPTTTAARSQTSNNMLNHGVLQSAGPQTEGGCLDYMRFVFMGYVNIRQCSRGALSRVWAGSQQRDGSGVLSTKGGG